MKKKCLCKTIFQYNKQPISTEDMEKLLEIAQYYQKVKAYVYQRYAGIKSLEKIYPGYSVQKEMGKCEFREQLGLPAVYFNVAILDALGDIKTQWTRIKNSVLKDVQKRDDFSEDEKHYLRYVLKVSNAFEPILNQKNVQLEPNMQMTYEEIASKVEVQRLNSYLRREVRKYHRPITVKNTDGFTLTERAYRYSDHGISITTKEKRKRVFIELTDNNAYKRQIYIKLFPKEGNVKLYVPVEVACKTYADYQNEIGLSIGMRTMLTTDKGHMYGAKLGEYHASLAQWMRQQNTRHSQQKDKNIGCKKYQAQKHKYTEQIHSYINMELNRFLQTEKPKIIYMPKLPPTQKHSGKKEINYAVSTWERGYIRKRLEQKCTEYSIELVEVFGKDISNICSNCQCIGVKKDEVFQCPNCGFSIPTKENSARNAKNRGIKSEDLDKSQILPLGTESEAFI